MAKRNRIMLFDDCSVLQEAAKKGGDLASRGKGKSAALRPETHFPPGLKVIVRRPHEIPRPCRDGRRKETE